MDSLATTASRGPRGLRCREAILSYIVALFDCCILQNGTHLCRGCALFGHMCVMGVKKLLMPNNYIEHTSIAAGETTGQSCYCERPPRTNNYGSSIHARRPERSLLGQSISLSRSSCHNDCIYLKRMFRCTDN